VRPAGVAGDVVIGVDIGGTFTDCAVIDEVGRVHVGKVPTTPRDRSLGFFNAIDEVARGLDLTLGELLGRCHRLVHGTTTGTNAIVTRTGARVGLLTTAGHADVMYIMKGTGRTADLETAAAEQRDDEAADHSRVEAAAGCHARGNRNRHRQWQRHDRDGEPRHHVGTEIGEAVALAQHRDQFWRIEFRKARRLDLTHHVWLSSWSPISIPSWTGMRQAMLMQIMVFGGWAA